MTTLDNTILYGDCVEVLRRLPEASVDLVVTDPPYVAAYRDRDGRTVYNDRVVTWIRPAFNQVARVLKPGRFCVCFYGWHLVERFMLAWKDAGLRPFAHLVWTKGYASNRGLVSHHHEQAYVLAKGRPMRPLIALRDVMPWQYTGNRLHPTQKPVSALKPVIAAFSLPGELVLDPFLGSGSTAVAAQELGRRYLGVECVKHYVEVSRRRLATTSCHRAAMAWKP